jgi:regulator of nucleoside diphosphate kinase
MNANKSQILFSSRDFQRISALIKNIDSEVSVLLEEELARATVLPDESQLSDVVSMNSYVRFQDLDSKKVTEVTIVYPHEADSDSGKISVLAPVGAALIGLRVGQSIVWPVPNGRKRRIEVLSVSKEVQEKAS